MRGIRKRIDQRKVVVEAGRRIAVPQWYRCWSSVFVKYALRVTYLVRQVVAAFWKSAEVQTQVVSVLAISMVTLFTRGSTHMELQPAEAAAWVTHWRTQAEIPLDD